MTTRPLLLGHRGARGEKSIPENSLASFDLCLAQACEGFEFDVRLSRDGHAVLCHDATWRRMRIANSAADRLQLPSLRNVLERYQHTAFLDIELKVAGLERIVADLLQALPPQKGYVVSSFLPDCLQALHEVNRSTPLGLICETRNQLKLRNELPVDYVIPHHHLLREALISELQQAGKKVLVWTVNSPAEIRRFASLGVEGIISDFPQVLVESMRS